MRILDSGFRIWDLGFGIWDSGFRINSFQSMLRAVVRIWDYLLAVDAACGGEDMGFRIED